MLPAPTRGRCRRSGGTRRRRRSEPGDPAGVPETHASCSQRSDRPGEGAPADRTRRRCAVEPSPRANCNRRADPRSGTGSWAMSSEEAKSKSETSKSEVFRSAPYLSAAIPVGTWAAPGETGDRLATAGEHVRRDRCRRRAGRIEREPDARALPATGAAVRHRRTAKPAFACPARISHTRRHPAGRVQRAGASGPCQVRRRMPGRRRDQRAAPRRPFPCVAGRRRDRGGAVSVDRHGRHRPPASDSRHRACYGTSVHHCPYCDGWEWRDRPLAVLGKGVSGSRLALSLKNWSPQVTLCLEWQPARSAACAQRLERNGIGIRAARVAGLDHTGWDADRGDVCRR